LATRIITTVYKEIQGKVFNSIVIKKTGIEIKGIIKDFIKFDEHEEHYWEKGIILNKLKIRKNNKTEFTINGFSKREKL